MAILNETMEVESYLRPLLTTDATLLANLPGGIHFRYVTDENGLPPEEFPAYVAPTLVWDTQEGPDTTTGGDRVLSETIVTLKVVAEDAPTPDDFYRVRNALNRFDEMLRQVRVDVFAFDDPGRTAPIRIRLINIAKIDLPERVPGGRYLRHRGRQYRAVVSMN